MRRLLAGTVMVVLAATVAACGGSGSALMTEQEAIDGIRESIQTDETDAELKRAMEVGCELIGLVSEDGWSVQDLLEHMESDVGTARAMNLSIVQAYAVQSICPEYEDWLSSGGG